MGDGRTDDIDWAWFFLRFGGRVSRSTFFLGIMLLGVIAGIPFYRFSLVPPESGEAQFWASVLLLLLIAALWVQAALGVKRLHDLGKPGIAAVSLFIPPVSLIAFVVLCLLPGTPGPNAYGRRTNAPA